MALRNMKYDDETGEVFEDKKIATLEDLQRKTEFINKKKSEDEYDRFIGEHFGKFYFLFYKLIKKGIPKQYVFRFLYICSHMDYDNQLIYGNQKGDGKYMTEKDLQEVLQLGKTEVYNTIKVLLKENLLLKNEYNKLYVNNKYCLKGKLQGGKIRANKTRIFENGIKELYEKSKPSQHKKIHILIELLPYINKKYNILCKNPDCEMKKEIIPLTLKEVCKIIKYSESQHGRLKKELLKLKIGDDFAIKFNETGLSSYIEINPRIYYKGGKEQFDGLLDLMDSFDIEGGK